MQLLHTLEETMTARFEGEIDEIQDIVNHGIDCGFHGFTFYYELNAFWEAHGDELESYYYEMFGDKWIIDSGAAWSSSVDGIKQHLIWHYVQMWCSRKLDEALDEVCVA